MMQSLFSPRIVLSYSHPRPLGPHKVPPPPHPIKLYFLLICPQLLQLLLIKPVSLIKIYLTLQINLSHQNQNNFQQNLNNIIKVFNKTISQQKQKSHNTKSIIQQYINLFIIKTKENVKIGTLFPTLLEEKKKEAESLVGQNKISR